MQAAAVVQAVLSNAVAVDRLPLSRTTTTTTTAPSQLLIMCLTVDHTCCNLTTFF